MIKIGAKRIKIYIAVIGLLVFLHLLNITRPAENLISRFLNPVFSSIHSFSSNLRATYNNQTSKIDLLARIKQLEARINQLTEENAGLKVTREENKILREHLLFLTKTEHNYVMSNVLSRGDIADLSSRTETIIIDRGARDGIYAGLGVVSSRGIIVGKVVEAKETIAKVYLTNNNRCKIAATILGEKGTSGIAEGELGLTVKMDFIPQDKEIKTGDIVITSGLEESIPRGLVIGRVSTANKESNELWQTAAIEPMIDPDELVIVSVLLP